MNSEMRWQVSQVKRLEFGHGGASVMLVVTCTVHGVSLLEIIRGQSAILTHHQNFHVGMISHRAG